MDCMFQIEDRADRFVRMCGDAACLVCLVVPGGSAQFNEKHLIWYSYELN